MILNESAPTGDNVSRERCFKVMQANIYITQVLLPLFASTRPGLTRTASFAVYGSAVP